MFEDELFSINEAMKHLLMRLWLRNDSIILIDSKSAIQAISNDGRDKYKAAKNNIWSGNAVGMIAQRIGMQWSGRQVC